MKKFIPVILVIILFTFGCSGGGSITTAPSPEKESANLASHTLWGMWQFTADPANGTLDAVQLRMSDIHLNALRFLEPPPFLYITVENLQFNGNTLEVDIGLRHPFVGLDQFTGFDTRGIIISNGSVSGFSDPAIMMAGSGDTRLLNPDGYTRWWNPAEFPHAGTMQGYIDGLMGNPDSLANFSSTLNAYKFFCDDISDPDAPLSDVSVSSRCIFTAGAQNLRHYIIEIGGDGFIFNYAIDASWKMPVGPPPYDVPADFPEVANCPEAWNARVTEDENTLWNDGINSGGSLTLDIELWDHFDAGHNMIYVESPGNFDPVGPIGAGPVTQYSAVYEVNILSATPAEGSIDILITAESDSTGYQGLLPGEPVSAYFIYTAAVGSGSPDEPPVAVAEIVSEPPFAPADPVTFDAGDSYDPDGGGIVSYEWDFDGDLSYGDSYDSGTDDNPTKIFNDAGTYFVNVRVTDDESDTDVLDDPLVVFVSEPDEYIWVDDDAVEPYLGTFEQPYLTVQMGVDAANANYPDFSHIMVKDGTYPEEVVVTTGNLIMEGYSTPAPLIMSPDDSTHDLISIGTNADDMTIKHFRLQPRTDMRGIYASGSDQVIDDIELLNNPGGPTCSTAIYVGSWSGTGNRINNVRVNGYHAYGYPFMSVSGEDIVVTNCVLLNITFEVPSNLNILSVNGNTSSNPHPDLLIAKNVIGHITHSETIDDTEWCRAMSLSYVEGATIRNNLIFDIVNKHTGGWTWGIDVSNAEDITIEHNTISKLTGPAWIYALEVGDWNTDPSGVTHRDHIITDLVTTGTMQSWRWAYLGNWNDTPLLVDYSCAYSVGNAFASYDDVAEGTGFITSNPQFLNASLDDYRITPGSPASGTAHDGTDMGAYGGSDPLTWLPE